MADRWEAQRGALGAFIREQRKQANLSLRQLAEQTSLSNPYLSQVERGLHQPSVRVLRAISDAFNLSAETLLAQAGMIDKVASTVPGQNEAAQDEGQQDDAGQGEAGHGEADSGAQQTEDAIRADERLSGDQKAAMIAVYRSMLA